MRPAAELHMPSSCSTLCDKAAGFKGRPGFSLHACSTMLLACQLSVCVVKTSQGSSSRSPTPRLFPVPQRPSHLSYLSLAALLSSDTRQQSDQAAIPRLPVITYSTSVPEALRGPLQACRGAIAPWAAVLGLRPGIQVHELVCLTPMRSEALYHGHGTMRLPASLECKAASPVTSQRLALA